MLDRINKKLESLEIVERSITNTKVGRKNDSFLELLKKMKALNLEKEREFEAYHKSPLAKTMTDNWHNRQKDNLVSTDISMNMTDIKNSKKYSLIETSDEQNNLKTLKTTLTEKKESSPIEIMQKEDDIERQKSNNKKDDLIMERITHIEDKGMIRKCIIKEMLEKIERQNDNTLKLANIETLRKKLDIERDIEKRKTHDKERDRKGKK